MSNQYFVRRGGKIAGPLTGAQMQQFLSTGKVVVTDEVGGTTEGPWYVVGDVPSMRQFLPASVDPAPAAAPSPLQPRPAASPPQANPLQANPLQANPLQANPQAVSTPAKPLTADPRKALPPQISQVGGSTIRVDGRPSFAHIHVELAPGETIIGEADAMSSMAGEMDLRARLNGGFFSAVKKKFLGGESMFINEYTNNTDRPLPLTLAPGVPGDIRQVELNGESLCLQPGAFIACTPGIRLGTRWAGFASLIAREGLFKLQMSGTGTLWYGAYGSLIEREIDGEYIVDTGHLVAYEPQMRLKIQLAGGIFSSFFGGEGLVTRVEGKGKIVMQTRSLSGLASWLNPFLPA